MPNLTDEEARKLLTEKGAPENGNLFVNNGNTAYLGNVQENSHGARFFSGIGLVVDGGGHPQFYQDPVFPPNASFVMGDEVPKRTLDRMRVLQGLINEASNKVEL